MKKELALLEDNIHFAEQVKSCFHDITFDAILQMLPEELRPFISFQNPKMLRLPADPVMAKTLLEWANAPYDRSNKYPQHLRHKTSDGELMRSKSEVIIYEKLKNAGIAFRYEENQMIDGCAISLDFKILRTDMKLWYWEHCGLMNRPQYVNDLKWKLTKYEKAGITLWNNLILTFDDENENLDVRIIDSEIKNKLIL